MCDGNILISPTMSIVTNYSEVDLIYSTYWCPCSFRLKCISETGQIPINLTIIISASPLWKVSANGKAEMAFCWWVMSQSECEPQYINKIALSFYVILSSKDGWSSFFLIMFYIFLQRVQFDFSILYQKFACKANLHVRYSKCHFKSLIKLHQKLLSTSVR